MKLGGSKWRPLGATVVFDGTCVVVERTVEVEEIVVLDEDVLDTVVTGTSVVLVLLVSFWILLPRNKNICFIFLFYIWQWYCSP